MGNAFQRTDRFQRGKVLCLGLPRQSVHDVHIDVGKARIHGAFDGCEKARAGVDAPDRGEQAVIRRLQADGQAVHAGRAVGGKPLAIRSAGIALRGDLRIRIDRVVIAQRIEDGRHLLAGQQRRRTAAEEYGLDAPELRQPLSGERDLPPEQTNISAYGFRLGKRDEIAIGALFDTIWNVDIDPGHQLMRSTLMNASLGTCTEPTWRMRFLPSFCFSSSFFLRVISPP